MFMQKFAVICLLAFYTVDARFTESEIDALIEKIAEVVEEEADFKQQQKRVINGHDVNSSWPFLVSMRQTLSFLNIPFYTYHFCGASLLNKRWLLTAAHCFGNKTNEELNTQESLDQFDARLGDKDLQANFGETLLDFGAQILQALDQMFDGEVLTNDDEKEIKDWINWKVAFEKIIMHPDYKNDQKTGYENDIALVKLALDVPAAPNVVSRIQKVDLPEQSEDLIWPPDGAKCIMKGWGCTELGGDLSEKVVRAYLTKRPDEQCSQLFNHSFVDRICAGPMPKKSILEKLKHVDDPEDLLVLKLNNTGSSGCPGDSGGPLMCFKNGEFLQAGVVSYIVGVGDVASAFPTVFTRVTHYVDWINNMITRDGIYN